MQLENKENLQRKQIINSMLKMLVFTRN